VSEGATVSNNVNDGPSVQVRRLHVGLAIAFAFVVPTFCLADNLTDRSPELPTGIVTFVGGNHIVTDSEIIEIGRDAVRFTTTLRSVDSLPRSALMAFGLPEIDMAALGGSVVNGVNYDPNNPTNYIGFWARADNTPIPLKVEQRAFSLGLIDITQQLQRHSIALYPLAHDVPDVLTALSPTVRAELLELAAIQLSDGQFEPLWTLRTAYYWSQIVPPLGKTLKLTYGYRPVLGSSTWNADTAEGLIERFCIDANKVAELNRRLALAVPVFVKWVHVQANSSGQARGAATEFTISLERPSERTLLATCHDGLRPTLSSRLEFKARDHVIDDDVLVAFID
jgi:hypothetical protein